MSEITTESIFIEKDKNRIYQGDVYEDIDYKIINRNEDVLEEITITFPYVVILTQDCDLEQDYNNRNNKDKKDEDKYLQSILVCPAFIATEVKTGEHLKKLEIKRETWNRDLWKPITRNENKRFHYLENDDKFKTTDLAIDFKQYYTIPRDEMYSIYKDKYKTSIKEMFREDLSGRFAFYLSRIGLPIIKKLS